MIQPEELADLLDLTTSVDALYDDFSEVFGSEALHFFGTFLILKTAQSSTGKKAARKLFRKGARTGDVLYVLCREVTIPPTPGILPTLDRMAQRAAETYLANIGNES